MLNRRLHLLRALIYILRTSVNFYPPRRCSPFHPFFQTNTHNGVVINGTSAFSFATVFKCFYSIYAPVYLLTRSSIFFANLEYVAAIA